MGARQQGFSLIELMVVMVIFLIVSGAVFALLDTAQVRYRAEQQFLESFQGGRLGVDLMVSDIHNAGYPPPYTFAGNLPYPATGPTPGFYPGPIPWTDPTAAGTDLQRRFAVGIMGIRGAVVDSTCTVNGGLNPCDIPNPWEIMLELDIDPENPAPHPVTGLRPQVEWVHYYLIRPAGAQTSSLIRAVAPKVVVAGADPSAATVSNIPFVENVVQDPTQAVNAVLPDATLNVPMFTFECDPNTVIITGTQICTAENVQNIYVAVRVRSSQQDIRTRQFRQLTIQGMARRLNPSR